MAKIWPLFVIMGTAATAAAVSVWAASATWGLSLELSTPDAEQGPFSINKETAPDGGTGKADNAPIRSGDSGLLGKAGDTMDRLPVCTATQYARALQKGQADEVIGMTHWMQERLKRVRLGSDRPEDLEAAREALRRDIQSRTFEENRLRPEGVEDKYVFAPGACIEVIGSDRRENLRDDALALPVKRRTWLRVEYPSPDAALRDEAGRPIRSIIVGVDVSKEGSVLKAGVLGNLEINRDAIALNWEQ